MGFLNYLGLPMPQCSVLTSSLRLCTTDAIRTILGARTTTDDRGIRCDAVDVYAFAEADVMHDGGNRHSFLLPPAPTAVQALTKLAEQEAAQGWPTQPGDGITHAARTLSAVLRECEEWRCERLDEHARLRIAAFATNLPGISSPDTAPLPGSNWTPRQQAVAILKTVIQIARLVECDPPVACVELVLGPDFALGHRVSRPTQTALPPHAVITGREGLELRLAAAVESLVALSGFVEQTGARLRLGIELEPGPSYLANSLETLGQVFDALKDPCGECRHVGINLDIGHAILVSRDDPELINKLRTDEWRRRIVHAHVSRHATAHFSDLPLRAEDRDRFMPWVDLYLDAYFDPPPDVPKSGAIALELERAHRPAEVADSTEILTAWMRRSLDRHRVEEGTDFVYAVVLYIDIVGSTATMFGVGLGTLADLLSRYTRRVIRLCSRHHGHLDKFLGDGGIALFPIRDERATPYLDGAVAVYEHTRRLPTTFDDLLQGLANLPPGEAKTQVSADPVDVPPATLYENALRCVRDQIDNAAACALDIARETANILNAELLVAKGTRIGIDFGQIALGNIGTEPRPEMTAVGLPMVTASRLMNREDLGDTPAARSNLAYISDTVWAFGAFAEGDRASRVTLARSNVKLPGLEARPVDIYKLALMGVLKAPRKPTPKRARKRPSEKVADTPVTPGDTTPPKQRT